ncbi:hypothetical protein J6590_015327 [Homalodisca vitripennis]|nr:hypothetical protein J6590_015327 [Homalodisca vitripennis]
MLTLRLFRCWSNSRTREPGLLESEGTPLAALANVDGRVLIIVSSRYYSCGCDRFGSFDKKLYGRRHFSSSPWAKVG